MIGFKRLTPLGNRILVRKAEPLTKTASGILLQSKDKEQLNWGEVLAVGPGKLNDEGKRVPISVKKGDTVLLPEWGGSKVQLADEIEYHIYRDDDIVGILSEKAT